jgi:hypothetical protein
MKKGVLFEHKVTPIPPHTPSFLVLSLGKVPLTA